ncbi:hypothetical protein DSL72_006661 [Monilinia vaccinii-corymbosi]|uniref:N-acetyltransferase domain-containing protein n=1 Tax=Monilinia vaccinii-corymbosi TaxID=61207 RepID=A0A8A3PMZ3_9HELO|nr:hypothetical protein DSL72_006661 [Monilinia vaccinii-corymbosi]
MATTHLSIASPHPQNNTHTTRTLNTGTSTTSTPQQEIQLLPCTKADLYDIALLEHLAFEHDEFSDVAFGKARGSEPALKMRMQQFGKFLEGDPGESRAGEGEGDVQVQARGWYTKAVVWEGEGESSREVVVGIAGWSLGGGKMGGKSGEDVVGSRVSEVSEVPEVKTREELDEIWGKGSNVQLCEDVFVRGDEYMFRACGDREWLKLNILVVHPNHQRLGIGTRLLEQGLQFADAKGFQTVLGASPWGIGLYRNHGFVEVHVMDIRLHEYEGGEGMGTISHVIMRRPGRGE